LWYKDEFYGHFKLFDLFNSPRVYAGANHVDDVSNSKPSNVVHDEVGDVVAIMILQFYDPTICLDIKDFDVYDLDLSNDHVSFNTIVCHQFV
jgi:hypothetical protein